ncbi:putative ABC transporter ATP-binding protein [Spirochaetia bacterium]|nr:putative ABC transporter ATP-binding protein [Spirochaetia bacterium]
MDFLTVQDLSYSYDGPFPALSEINFTIKKGSCVCVAGANGSGKSTLLQLLSGCMKPSKGDILLDGLSIFKDEKIRRKTGIVFQEPDNQLFMPTVWEDVAFAVLQKGTNPQDARKMAEDALELVEAKHLADRPPYKLSGGEKQRAAIASILISFQSNIEDKILLIDEPTASLDPRARKNCIALLKKLTCTRIIASHDLDMALDLCNETLFLQNGRIAESSPAPGLLLDETFLQSIGLELPLRRAAPPLSYHLEGAILSG